MNARGIKAVLGMTAIVWMVGTSGCANKGRGTSSPERLVDAHLAALQANDPHAAYALLSPQAKAKTPYEEFEARWKADATEREATIKGIEERPADQLGALHGGTTVHRGGHELHWTEVGDRYLITAGLPGRPQTETPAQTIRSFIAAVRKAQLASVTALLGDELSAALDEDWQTRVEAIEAALEEPGALELSSDLRRASLQYDAQHALTLEQTADGWRITALQ